MGKRDYNILSQRFKLRHNLEGCPIHFWPTDATRRKIHSTQQANKTKSSKPSLDNFRRPQMIDLCLFLLRRKRSNACSHCGHRSINKIKSQDSGKPSNFRHLLLLKNFFVSIIFNSTKRLFSPLFFHLPHEDH